MPVPIVTFGIVIMRASLRPINKVLIKYLKNAKAHPMGFQFFSTIGHGTHKMDLFIKNAGSDAKSNKTGQDPGITDEKAFDLGIDWFTEIFFFYGTLVAVCYWEYCKFQAGQRLLNSRIKKLEDDSVTILEALGRVKDRQTVTRKDLEQVITDIERVITINKSLSSQSAQTATDPELHKTV